MKKPKALNHTDRVLSWISQGMRYGYPPCCIGEFVIHWIKDTCHTRKKRKFDGTGFIPCIKCNTRTKRALLKELAARRSEPKPFPDLSS